MLRATRVTQFNRVNDKLGNYLAFSVEVLDATTGDVWTVVVDNICNADSFLDHIEIGVANGAVPEETAMNIEILPLGSYPIRVEHFAVGHALVHAAQYAALIAAKDKRRAASE